MRRETADSGPIRVVVGEDSPFMRRMITDSLGGDPSIEVVGVAGNGREVLRKLNDLRPDCITLDLEMPQMDGLETLRYIMSEWPTPVVILSSHTSAGEKMAVTCLEYGAVDFVAKTSRGKRFPVDELISKVKLAATVDASKVRFAPPESHLRVGGKSGRAKETDCLVVIGASTGGPQALSEIVPRIPAGLDAGIVIVQHMPPNFTKYLAERLDSRSAVAVREAKEGDHFFPGRVLVAPGGMHLFVEQKVGKPSVMLIPRNDLQRTACPSIDFTMTSFSSVFGERLLCVIMTGMGRDGTAGSIAVHRNGGRVICQDRETSMIFGMPGAVISEGKADRVVRLADIPACIQEHVEILKKKEPAHGIE